jgi:DNA-binding response OmpR family regulator
MPLASETKSVLCVEDSSDTCGLISAILPGFDVVSSATLTEAWELYGTRRFSLIIIDFHLEDGSGLDLCERIRKRDYLTPIVIISGDHELSEAEVRMAGAQRFITKGTVTFIDDLMSAVGALHVT